MKKIILMANMALLSFVGLAAKHCGCQCHHRAQSANYNYQSSSQDESIDSANLSVRAQDFLNKNRAALEAQRISEFENESLADLENSHEPANEAAPSATLVVSEKTYYKPRQELANPTNEIEEEEQMPLDLPPINNLKQQYPDHVDRIIQSADELEEIEEAYTKWQQAKKEYHDLVGTLPDEESNPLLTLEKEDLENSQDALEEAESDLEEQIKKLELELKKEEQRPLSAIMGSPLKKQPAKPLIEEAIEEEELED